MLGKELPQPSSLPANAGCYLCGNLVIEYRKDMHRRWGDPDASLRLALAQARALHLHLPLSALATNGLSFHVYTPEFDSNGQVTELRPADGLNLASPMMTPRRATKEISAMLKRWLK